MMEGRTDCNDAVDNIRELMTEANSNLGKVFDHIDDVERDLMDVLSRADRVRSLASRFKGVEVSPHVKELMSLVERRAVAV
jgi:hypothetical protein